MGDAGVGRGVRAPITAPPALIRRDTILGRWWLNLTLMWSRLAPDFASVAPLDLVQRSRLHTKPLWPELFRASRALFAWLGDVDSDPPARPLGVVEPVNGF